MAVLQERIGGQRVEAMIKDQPLTVFLEGEKDAPEGFKISSSLIKYITEQNPRILNRIEILDEHSEHLFRSERKRNSVSTEFWKTQIKNDGEFLREQFEGMEFPFTAKNEISDAYSKLCKKRGKEEVLVEVSLDEGSAGQQVAFLSQSGKADVIGSVRKCLISEFTDQAILSRNEARMEEVDKILESNSGNFLRALRDSREFSHKEVRPVIVVREMTQLHPGN